ncbi:hypothetical protein HHK36_006541 [Tetracentron sinense]|uniref:CCHC-type domain-containing protein n=1 Tax=Tetracentron sinense TaxID=13715 RepID=A0A834ZL18_TETSI|nr:hypothetical protein HHK36_006541 [Tetracentron sinense]
MAADHQRIHPVDVEAPPPTAPLVPPDSAKSDEGHPIEQYPRFRRTIPVIHSKPPRKRSCCCKCLCWIISLLLLLVIIVGAAAGILYLVFQPKLPKYSVDRLRITNFRLNVDMSLYAEFHVKITATNPNEKIGIYYEEGSHLSVWYANSRLCQGSLPKFYQGHRNTTVFDVALTGQTQDGSNLLTALQEQQQSGNIPLDLKVGVPVRIKLGKLKLKKVKFLGRFPNVIIQVDTLNALGSVSYGPKGPWRLPNIIKEIMDVASTSNILYLWAAIKLNDVANYFSKATVCTQEIYSAVDPLDAAVQGEISALRRQVEALTQRLAQMENPVHDDGDDEPEDEFENPFHDCAPRREPYERDNQRWELGSKVEILEFHGGLRAEEFIDWLVTVECIFEYVDVPGDKKNRGGIRVENTHDVGVRSTPRGTPVRDTTVDGRSSRSRVPENSSIAPVNQPTAAGQTVRNQSRGSSFRCFKCGDPGHRLAECRKNSSREGKHFLIGEGEDVEEDDLDDGVECDAYEDDDEGAIIHGDVGEALLLRKSLLAPKQDAQEDWLRTNIFHTTCTIGGKVCKLIIDSGDDTKQWDQTLSQAEFAFNRSKNRTTQCSPFEIVYGQNPNGVLDLAPIPNSGKITGEAEDLAEHIKSIHEQVRQYGKET